MTSATGSRLVMLAVLALGILAGLLIGFGRSVGAAVLGVLLILIVIAGSLRLRVAGGRGDSEADARDPLTGLPNRFALARRFGQPVVEAAGERGLVVCDLDGFKAVNDTFGHPTGDALIIHIADRLRAVAGRGDLVARTGGDEFALLLRAAGPAEVTELAGRVVAEIAVPFAPGTPAEILPRASVGATSITPGEDLESAFQRADLAMYGAKAHGGNRFEVFSEQAHGGHRARIRRSLELGHALDRDEFVLLYQPILDLKTLELIGGEALLRWNHPALGLLAPAEFMAAAEESGVIVEIGEWVLRHACAEALRWESDREFHEPSLALSVNVSRRQLYDPKLASLVKRVLEDTGLRPGLLQIEVTETALATDFELMLSHLMELNHVGVGISMDDFGTGYSSLTHLRQLPIDILKIDRAFVDGIARSREEFAMASAIIELAISLDKRTIAEGIETAPQLAHLRALGCDRGQGYLFSKPVPAEQFAAIRAKRNFRA